jgi:hypothetical protein
VIGGDGVVLVDEAMTFDVIQYQKAFATRTQEVYFLHQKWFNFVNITPCSTIRTGKNSTSTT